MDWQDFDTVFRVNSEHYANEEFEQEWAPYKAFIAKRDAALAGVHKYSRKI